MSAVALDRDALYYPYIHIRDVNWLKGTLLCFPQVRRIVPPGFDLHDSKEVRKFRDVEGRKGQPLLGEEYTETLVWESPVRQAQERLIQTLKNNEGFVLAHYLMEAAQKEYGERYDSFQMHTGKFMHDLAEYVLNSGLGWLSRELHGRYTEERWISLHPRLGEAIMSVISIAIARDKGLDIVTSSGSVHHALAVQDEEEVLNRIVGLPGTKKDTPGAEKVDELAQIMMTTCFNLERLSAEQIAELIKDGKDLRAFKNALVPIAESIPEILDKTEREKKLKQKAEEVIQQWSSYRKSLPRFAVDALVESTEVKIPDVAAGVIAGATTGLALASGVGLAIGLLTWQGLRIWRKFKESTAANPYRFLSRVEKAGATLALSPPA